MKNLVIVSFPAKEGMMNDLKEMLKNGVSFFYSLLQRERLKALALVRVNHRVVSWRKRAETTY